MAAIGAIFERFGVPVPTEDAKRMGAALAVHGPRKRQHIVLGACAGCWAQSQIVVSEDQAESQPIRTHQGLFLFLGRLQYRKDLERALGLAFSGRRMISDAELACKAWNAWGRECISKLEGEWAIMAFNESDQSLFAARAPFNAPPLVFSVTAARIAIASAPRGLFALPAIPRELDEERIADSLILNYEDPESTYFKGIKRLRCGYTLSASRQDFSIRQFYQVSEIEKVCFANSDSYIEKLDHLIRDAIQSYSRSNADPACSLSSGLDSSTVAIYAAESLEDRAGPSDERLKCYTHVPSSDWDGRVYGGRGLGDESGPVRDLIAEYPQLDVKFVSCEGLPLDYRLDELIRYSEVPPFAWNNNHWSIRIAELASQNGHKVLLNGASGNRTISFNHPEILTRLFRAGRWREFAREVRSLEDSGPLSRRFLRYALRAMFPSATPKLLARLRSLSPQNGCERHTPINPAYAKDMQVAERAKKLGFIPGFGRVGSPDELRQSMSFGGLRDEGSLIENSVINLCGVEPRDPLGCKRITEFCLAIPPEEFMGGGVRRRLVRRLMTNRLPSSIINQRHRGRQAADWHARFTADKKRYRDEIERAANDPDICQRFNIPRIRALLDSWPELTPLDSKDHKDYIIAMVGLGRMITTTRFIHWVEGKNN
ncbi:MAG: asparagine synthase-related protein [Pseudomonadota bacterium]